MICSASRRRHAIAAAWLLVGTALAAQKGNVDARMTKSLKEFRDLARQQVAGVVPHETHVSFPIPVARNGKYSVTFLLATSIVKPNEGLLLLPPAHVVDLEWPSGKLAELRAVDPRAFGLNDDPQKVLGKYDMLPNGRTSEQFLEMQSRLYELYDLLAPSFLSGAKRVDTRRTREAMEFLDLFPKVTEQPLQPYYKATAAGFFAWLGNK
jgi:hypothetical protein